MASTEDVSLVIEKVQKGFETGDQCHATAWGKSASEWSEIFNQASAALKMPVVEVGPLKGPSLEDTLDQVRDITLAFEQSAGRPAIVTVDSTGNHFQRDRNINSRVSNYIEQLTIQFPKVVYVQVIPQSDNAQPLWLYCNNPKIPRDPSKPQYPL